MAGRSDGPRKLTGLESFVLNNTVNGLRVEFVLTGVDTADTFVVLERRDFDGKERRKEVRVADNEFRQLLKEGYAVLDINHCSIVRATAALEALDTARKKFEKDNSRDLSDYKRLYEKFGGSAP